MKTKIIWFMQNEDGQGMVEYSLILALVALAVIGALTLFGTATRDLFQKVVNSYS